MRAMSVPLGLSGLVLTFSSADATAYPDPLLKDVLPGSPVVSRRFGAAETLTLYAEAYDRATQARVITFVATVHDALDGRSSSRPIDAPPRGATCHSR